MIIPYYIYPNLLLFISFYSKDMEKSQDLIKSWISLEYLLFFTIPKNLNEMDLKRGL
jgi:hypothetical protein